jgi:hypothetical protein
MTDSTNHWLPERHLGVAATLSHADELIGQVGDLLFDYQTQADGVFGLREELAGSLSRTVVDRVAPIPRKIPLVVADALVALRAALEHALFAEVEFLDGSPLDEKAARLVEMPASDTYEKFEEWKKSNSATGRRRCELAANSCSGSAACSPSTVRATLRCTLWLG